MKRYFAKRQSELESQFKLYEKELTSRLDASDRMGVANVPLATGGLLDGHASKATICHIENSDIVDKPLHAEGATRTVTVGSVSRGESSSDADSDSDSDAGAQVPLTFRRRDNVSVALDRDTLSIQKAERRSQAIQIGHVQPAVYQDGTDYVDDTDGLDPEQELEDWKERERARVRREYERLEAEENEAQARLESRRKRIRVNDVL